MKRMFIATILFIAPALSSAATLSCGDEEVQISAQISEKFELSQASAQREGKDLKANQDLESRIVTRGPDKGFAEYAIASWSDACYLYLRVPQKAPIKNGTVLILCGDGKRKFSVPCQVTP